MFTAQKSRHDNSRPFIVCQKSINLWIDGWKECSHLFVCLRNSSAWMTLTLNGCNIPSMGKKIYGTWRHFMLPKWNSNSLGVECLAHIQMIWPSSLTTLTHVPYNEVALFLISCSFFPALKCLTIYSILVFQSNLDTISRTSVFVSSKLRADFISIFVLSLNVLLINLRRLLGHIILVCYEIRN